MARFYPAGMDLRGLALLPIRVTVAATQALRASGKKGKQARAVIDQAAAVALLQGVLDRRR